MGNNPKVNNTLEVLKSEEFWYSLFVGIFSYFITARIGLQLATVGPSATPFWPAAGISIFLIYQFGPRHILSVALGAFLANSMTDVSWATVFFITIGNTLEGVLGAWLIRKFKDQISTYPELKEPCSIVATSFVAPFLSATVGPLANLFFDGLSADLYFGAWITWYSGNAVGALIVLPALLYWFGADKAEPAETKNWSSLIAKSTFSVIFAFFICWFVFSNEYGSPFLFLIFSTILLTVILKLQSLTHVIALCVVVVSVRSTSLGMGPFAWGNVTENLFSLQIFLVAWALATMTLKSFAKETLNIRVVAILVIGWGLAGTVFYRFYNLTHEQDRILFVEKVQDIESLIRGKLISYKDALNGGVGLFSVNEKVTPQDWQSYIDAIGLSTRYAGIKGMGYISYIQSHEVQKFVEYSKNELGIDLQLKKLPKSSLSKPTTDHFFITMYEATYNKANVVGLDIGSEKSRRLSAELARDTGSPAITSKLALFQNDASRPGFSFYVPHYKIGAKLDTLESRRRAFRGLVFGVFLFDDLLAQIQFRSQNDIEFAIYDDDINPNQPIYIRGRRAGAPPPMSSAAKLIVTRPFEVAQKKFRIHWTPGSEYSTSQDYTLAWIAALGAIVILAAAWFYSSIRSFRLRAEQIVSQKTREINERTMLWKTLTESAPVGIFQTDVEGKLVYVNPLWLEIIGESLEEIKKNGIAYYIHQDDQSRIVNKWRKVLQEGKSFADEFRFVRKSGEIRWVSSMAQPFSLNGKNLGFIGINLDITERKNQDTLLETERLKSLQASKMATLGEMAGGIAHEINNPLAIIIGRIAILKEAIKRQHEPEKILEHADKIESTVYRIAKLIRGLRAFSRESSNDSMSLTSLSSIVDDTLEFCRERFKNHNVDLIVEGDMNLQVNCRPSQISQALLNLLNNAFDAVAEHEKPWVRVEVMDTGYFVEISVTDSGNGIPVEIAKKLWEPFFTTKEVGKGTGLGLSISHGLIESHKGKLWLDRRSPNTRFVIALPLAKANQDSSDGSQAA